MKMDEKMKWSNKAGPGVLFLVDLAKNAGKGRMPRRAISCLTALHSAQDCPHLGCEESLPLTAEYVADMMFPAAEIASNVPDAVRVFGEGPNTSIDESSST